MNTYKAQLTHTLAHTPHTHHTRTQKPMDTPTHKAELIHMQLPVSLRSSFLGNNQQQDVSLHMNMKALGGGYDLLFQSDYQLTMASFLGSATDPNQQQRWGWSGTKTTFFHALIIYTDWKALLYMRQLQVDPSLLQ